MVETSWDEWPLMMNNVTRGDLDTLIEYLRQDDPRLTHGPLVRKFEEEFATWVGVSEGVMVNSGSSANDLTMIALKNLHGGGEVIVPPLAWVSDISAVLRAGLDPVFVDIDPKTLAMSAEGVAAAITPKTRAVFLTHILGIQGLTPALEGVLESSGIPLIEDVCESHGASYQGRRAGSLGWISNFSFYYAHHMTTIEGGMVCTSDPDLADMIRVLRSHGMVRESRSQQYREQMARDCSDLNPDFIFAYASHNMRATELQGLMGLSQLPRLDTDIELRNANFDGFLRSLDEKRFRTDFSLDGMSNYALILVLRDPDLDLRDRIEERLRMLNVEFRRGLSGGGNQLRQPYLGRDWSEAEISARFPEVEHVHHFGWYIGNYPSLPSEWPSELGRILNSV